MGKKRGLGSRVKLHGVGFILREELFRILHTAVRARFVALVKPESGERIEALDEQPVVGLAVLFGQLFVHADGAVGLPGLAQQVGVVASDHIGDEDRVGPVGEGFLEALLHPVVLAQGEINNREGVVDADDFVEVNGLVGLEADERLGVVAYAFKIIIAHGYLARHAQEDDFPNMVACLLCDFGGVSLLALQNLLRTLFVAVPPPVEGLFQSGQHHVARVPTLPEPLLAVPVGGPADHRVLGERLHGVGVDVGDAVPVEGLGPVGQVLGVQHFAQEGHGGVVVDGECRLGSLHTFDVRIGACLKEEKCPCKHDERCQFLYLHF